MKHYVQVKSRAELKALISSCIRREGPYCDLNFVDVSNLQSLHGVFSGSPFNGDINKWDVSRVTDLSKIFYQSEFTGDISEWDVSSVTNMQEMFAESKFNGDISQWDVSSVTNMSDMFSCSDFPRFLWVDITAALSHILLSESWYSSRSSGFRAAILAASNSFSKILPVRLWVLAGIKSGQILDDIQPAVKIGMELFRLFIELTSTIQR